MRPGLHKAAHMGKVQRPKGFVLHKKTKARRKTGQSNQDVETCHWPPRTCVRESKDSKTLEQAWVRYLRVNSKTWVRATARRIRRKLVFCLDATLIPSFSSAEILLFGRSYSKGEPPKLYVHGQCGCIGGGTIYVYIHIYIYILML